MVPTIDIGGNLNGGRLLRFSSLKRYKLILILHTAILLSGSSAFAQCVYFSNNYWMTGTSASGTTPAGDQAVTTNTGTPNGFTPTSTLSSTPLYWYSPAMTGLFNAGSYTLTLWSDSPGAASNVTVELGTSNPNGSGFTSMGTLTADVNGTGGGNHATNFTFSLGVLSLTNQVLVIKITQASGTPAVIVYNDGTDFGSVLTIPTGQSPACPTWTPTPCGYTQQVETDGISDKVMYLSSIGDSEPANWTLPSFNSSGWSNASIWGSPTGAGISGIPWASWTSGGTSNGSDKELVIHSFTLPAGATVTSATLNLAVDDNSSSTLNGTSIQSDPNPTTTITNQAVRSFSVPTGAFTTGTNILAIDNASSVASFIGYDFQLVIYYIIPCTATPTVTNTQTSTPTRNFTDTSTATSTNSSASTPTSSQTNTSTIANSPTNTATNSSTASNTNTATHSATSTNTQTATSTPSQTATQTSTNTPTLVNTATNTATSTWTNTSTNSATSTDTLINTATSTQTETSTPSDTPTNTFTHTPTNAETAVNSYTNTATSTNSSTPTATFTNSPTISNTSTSTSSSTNTHTSTATVTHTPTQTNTMTATRTQTSTTTNTTTSTHSPTPTITSTFTFTNSPTPVGPFTVNVNIYNEAGEVVRTILVEHTFQPVDNISLSGSVITLLQGPGSTVDVYYSGSLLGSWNGLNNNGNPVSNGSYRIQVDNVSSNGSVTSVSQRVTVNRAASKVTVQVFNEAGELVRTLYTSQSNSSGANLNDVILASNFISPGHSSAGTPSQAQILLQTSNGSMALTWDGMSQGGTYVTPGRYEIDVHWDNGQSSAYDIHRSLIVENTVVTGNLVAEPNELKGSNQVTTFDATGVAGATLVKATIYTLSGQKVVAKQGQPGTAQAQWDASGMASGIYLAVVEADDANGNRLLRKILKVMVLR